MQCQARSAANANTLHVKKTIAYATRTKYHAEKHALAVSAITTCFRSIIKAQARRSLGAHAKSRIASKITASASTRGKVVWNIANATIAKM